MNNILTSLRPHTLSEFVSTADIKLKLLNVLEEPQKYKTYLISGPSGIGKTTFARIFANNIGFNDNKVEYLEINCADTRGIDFARDLLPILSIRPLMHDYKIVVLDEAHMITTQAQNTLLKGLEEVPDSNFVVLCSTAPSNLIDTIRNRCYEIDLTPSSLEDIGLRTSLARYGQLIGRENGSKKLIEDSSILSIAIDSFLERNIPERLSIRQFTVFISDLLDRLAVNTAIDTNEAINNAINSSVDKYDPILIARWMIKQKDVKAFREEHWDKVIEKVSNLNCTIESARLMFLSYFGKVLSSTKDESEKILCYNIMKLMLFDGTKSDAKARMLLVFRYMFNKNSELCTKYLHN